MGKAVFVKDHPQLALIEVRQQSNTFIIAHLYQSKIGTQLAALGKPTEALVHLKAGKEILTSIGANKAEIATMYVCSNCIIYIW